MADVKIVRAYYLTAVGQESLAYHFKVKKGTPEFEMIKPGDIAVSFYRTDEAITSIPALLRVDGVIGTDRRVKDFLRGEKKDAVPMLPIVRIYEHFDPLEFNQMAQVFIDFTEELKSYTRQSVVQGDLFEFEERG